jgi:hypothetical protein
MKDGKYSAGLLSNPYAGDEKFVAKIHAIID